MTAQRCLDPDGLWHQLNAYRGPHGLQHHLSFKKYILNMSGCFSFCLLSYILGIFSKTEQYFLLLDKLLPDSVMASSRPEENVVLNNFQHKRCISVGIPS